MFSQVLSIAQDHGHVDVEIIAKGVVLHGSRRIFAGLVPRDRGLGGMLNLLAPRQDARFTKVEPLTKRIWHHRFFLTDPRQLDEKFLGWVGEACDVGQGAASRSRHALIYTEVPDDTTRDALRRLGDQLDS
jgi:hypothetical protein